MQAMAVVLLLLIVAACKFCGSVAEEVPRIVPLLEQFANLETRPGNG